MLKSSLSNLAIVVFFSILFFVLITQRMMVNNDNTSEGDMPTKKMLNGSAPHSFKILSKLSNFVRNNTINVLRDEPVLSLDTEPLTKFTDTIVTPVSSKEDASAMVTVVSRIFRTTPAVEAAVKVSSMLTKSDHVEFLDVPNTKEELKHAPVSSLRKIDVNQDFSKTKATDTLVKVAKIKTKSGGHVEFLDTTAQPPPAAATVVAVTKAPKPKKDDRIHFLDSPTTASKAKATTELEFLDTIPPHPPISPRFGSDISPAAQKSLLQCHNQTKCIVPELQLQRKYKIYFCSHPPRSGGVRFYYLAREGFLLHPNVEMLPQSRMHQADYVVYLPGSAAWHRTECNDTTLAKKLIVLDEFDGHTLIAPTVGNSSEYARLYGGTAAPWYFMYFKRSFVRRSDGKFEGYPHLRQYDTFPMTYAVAEIYVRTQFKNEQRSTDIWCTLRGNEHMMTRLRVQQWVAEYAKSRGVKKVITENINTETRTSVSKAYFESMYDSQIIVTVNPMMWEGDFRLWEAMGTGALVFVDPVFVPHPFPLVSGEHVIYFSNTNKTELFWKLDYYRRNKEEARRIAINGYLHAMKYHRTVNLIDYVLRSTHLKEATISKSVPLPRYSFTGQYLNQEAKKQLDTIKECQYPGIYDDPISKSHRNVSALGVVASREHAQKLQCHASKGLSTNIQFLTRQ